MRCDTLRLHLNSFVSRLILPMMPLWLLLWSHCPTTSVIAGQPPRGCIPPCATHRVLCVMDTVNSNHTVEHLGDDSTIVPKEIESLNVDQSRKYRSPGCSSQLLWGHLWMEASLRDKDLSALPSTQGIEYLYQAVRIMHSMFHADWALCYCVHSLLFVSTNVFAWVQYPEARSSRIIKLWSRINKL